MNITQSTRVLLRQGSVYDPLRDVTEKKDIFIEDGVIQSLGNHEGPGDCEIIDCAGKIITSGFCDPHVHFREPGREDKETLASGAQAALAGGFTRVCVMPNTDPPLDTPEAIRFVVEKARDLPVHIHPIGAVTRQQAGREMTEMASMVAEGAVAFSDDGLPIADGRVMRLALEYSTMLGVPIINHAEEPSLRAGGLMHEGPMSTRLGLPGNPSLSESVMVHRDLELAQLTGALLHVPHVSSARSVEHIRRMKEEGARVTAEVTPHHLYFTDEALETYDTNLKVAPPIRSARDRQVLLDALRDGVLDCVATDHAPHTIEEKEFTFDMAPFGLIGLEAAFAVVNTARRRTKGFSLEHLLRKMALIPREIFGFPTDLLQTGAQAELVVLDPDREWTFTRSDIVSRSRNCPYVGETFTGKVEWVINGTTVAVMD